MYMCVRVRPLIYAPNPPPLPGGYDGAHGPGRPSGYGQHLRANVQQLAVLRAPYKAPHLRLAHAAGGWAIGTIQVFYFFFIKAVCGYQMCKCALCDCNQCHRLFFLVFFRLCHVSASLLHAWLASCFSSFISAKQNRFYLHGNVIGSLKTTLPLLMPELLKAGVNCIAFPDDGAAKRFAYMFAEQGFEIITCGKVRVR